MLSPLEQKLLQQAADLLTDQTDANEQHARKIILGVIADKEGDDRTSKAKQIIDQHTKQPPQKQPSQAPPAAAKS